MKYSVPYSMDGGGSSGSRVGPWRVAVPVRFAEASTKLVSELREEASLFLKLTGMCHEGIIEVPSSVPYSRVSGGSSGYPPDHVQEPTACGPGAVHTTRRARELRRGDWIVQGLPSPMPTPPPHPHPHTTTSCLMLHSLSMWLSAWCSGGRVERPVFALPFRHEA